jgi:hypothetical protein
MIACVVLATRPRAKHMARSGLAATIAATCDKGQPHASCQLYAEISWGHLHEETLKGSFEQVEDLGGLRRRGDHVPCDDSKRQQQSAKGLN